MSEIPTKFFNVSKFISSVVLFILMSSGAVNFNLIGASYVSLGCSSVYSAVRHSVSFFNKLDFRNYKS